MIGIRDSLRLLRRPLHFKHCLDQPAHSLRATDPIPRNSSASSHLAFTYPITVRQFSTTLRVGNSGIKTVEPYDGPSLDDLRDFIDDRDEVQIKLNQYLQQRLINPNSYNTYKSKNLLHTIGKDSIHTYPSENNIKQILVNNDYPPVVGSLIEFIDHEPSFGIVIREAQATFNENYNKVIVLSMDNELKYVPASSITFHHHQAVNPDWIGSLNILENRFDEEYYSRYVLVDILKVFLAQSVSASHLISSHLDIVHGQYSQPYTLASISLTELIESIKFDDYMLTKFNESYFDQCTLLMALHLNMVRDPKWLVSSVNFSSPSNVIGGWSNEIPHGSFYFVNSSSNCDALEKFDQVAKHDLLFAKLNEQLNALHSQQVHYPKSFDDLNIFFTIFEGRHFSYLLDVLKFLIFYPHSSILDVLQKLDVFENKVTPQTIHKLLEELKIYNNPKHPLTDIMLSANVMGKSSQIATSSLEVDDNSNVNGIADKFPHLRKEKLYYQDHVIYGLPNGQGSTLAISLEKVNSRKYLINVHIPDIATKISPSHELFGKPHEFLKKKIGAESLFDAFQFQNQHNEVAEEWQQVGDMLKIDRKHRRGKNTTCLTVSFTYSTYDSNPFSNIDSKVKVSFDSIQAVKIKNISRETLEDCLTGKAEVSPFKLFRRTKVDTLSTKLTSEDIHNINFIHNVMKSHFKIRNINGASSINPCDATDCQDSSSLSRDLSIVNKNRPHEKIITTISSKASNNKKHVQSMFLISEVEKFAANAASTFCINSSIPVYVRTQELIRDNESDSDSVLVSHNNLLLPNYNASNYYQTLIARDAKGYVSPAADLIGRNYLNKPTIEILLGRDQRNVPMGLKNGYVNICNPLYEYESMLNQLQILYYIQAYTSTKMLQVDSDHINMVKRFGYLKAYGYNLNGPLPIESMNEELTKIQNGVRLNSFLGAFHKRFWTLKMLELKLVKASEHTQHSTRYSCVITKVGLEISHLGAKLSTAYCDEIGIEVQILHAPSWGLNVGSALSCDKILHLDAIGGHCILRGEQTI